LAGRRLARAMVQNLQGSLQEAECMRVATEEPTSTKRWPPTDLVAVGPTLDRRSLSAGKTWHPTEHSRKIRWHPIDHMCKSAISQTN
jgi:hypothetical protein